MSSEMKRAGIYGGSFDPVHTGHVSLAADAADQFNLSKVIFVPTYIQPFKQDKTAENGMHRMNMLKAAALLDPRFAISDYELNSKDVSYTYRTLRVFQDQLGHDTRLYFICGTDSFLKIEYWKNAEEILSSYSFAVGTRPGYREEELEKVIQRVRNDFGTDVFRIENVKVDVSSSEIRKKITEGCDIKGLVLPETEKYIIENGLYK